MTTPGPEDGQPTPPNPYGAPYGQPYQQPHPQEYGQPYPPQNPPQYGQPYASPSAPNDGMAIASMVVGIVSVALMCGYGLTLLGSPVALGLGLAAKRRIDRSEGRVGGRGFAQTGFILGIIGTVLLALAIVLWIIVIIAAIVDGPS